MHPEIYYEFIHCMFSKCGVVCKAKMEKNMVHIMICYVRGRTIKFTNSPPCACHGSTGQKP